MKKLAHEIGWGNLVLVIVCLVGMAGMIVFIVKMYLRLAGG